MSLHLLESEHRLHPTAYTSLICSEDSIDDADGSPVGRENLDSLNRPLVLPRNAPLASCTNLANVGRIPPLQIIIGSTDFRHFLFGARQDSDPFELGGIHLQSDAVWRKSDTSSYQRNHVRTCWADHGKDAICRQCLPGIRTA